MAGSTDKPIPRIDDMFTCICGQTLSNSRSTTCDACANLTWYHVSDFGKYLKLTGSPTADDYVKDIKDQIRDHPRFELNAEPDPSDNADFLHGFDEEKHHYEVDYVVKEGKKYRRTWKVGDNGDRELVGWGEVGFDTTEADRISEGIRKIATSHPYRYEKATDTQIGGSHYKNMPIQPVKFITANDLGFCEGNVVKYICRYKEKGQVEDLQKAKHYIDLLIESMED